MFEDAAAFLHAKLAINSPVGLHAREGIANPDQLNIDCRSEIIHSETQVMAKVCHLHVLNHVGQQCH